MDQSPASSPSRQRRRCVDQQGEEVYACYILFTLLPLMMALLQQVIERANNVKYGLSACVWSENSGITHRVSQALDVSLVAHHFSSSHRVKCNYSKCLLTVDWEIFTLKIIRVINFRGVKFSRYAPSFWSTTRYQESQVLLTIVVNLTLPQGVWTSARACLFIDHCCKSFF